MTEGDDPKAQWAAHAADVRLYGNVACTPYMYDNVGRRWGQSGLEDDKTWRDMRGRCMEGMMGIEAGVVMWEVVHGVGVRADLSSGECDMAGRGGRWKLSEGGRDGG